MKARNQPLYLNVLTHSFFWLFFLVLFNFRWFSGPPGPPHWMAKACVGGIGLIGYFYLNAYYLFDVWYKRRGLITYIIRSLFVIVVIAQGLDFVNNVIEPRHHHPPDRVFFVMMPYLFIWAMSTSYCLMLDYAAQQRLLKEKETETLKTELSFLRSQVSPHFLFNVLNSMVSLARKKSDLLEPALIQLSGLMRYMLYESNHGKISLAQEVNYLRSYVDLQVLRFGEDIDLQMRLPKLVDGCEIEPMLLIALVENAFKHSMGASERPFISIQLEYNKEDSYLSFWVRNSLPKVLGEKDKSSGIGLHNMRRRLELLYDGRFSLDCSAKNNEFIAELTIKFQ